MNPPTYEKNTQEVVDLHLHEYNTIMKGLKDRAKLVTSRLNLMDNITCNEVQGSITEIDKF